MNRALFKKCFGEARWLWLACAAALFSFCWVRVWIVSRMETWRFQAIMDLLPEDILQFSPVDFEWMITYAGRISLTFDEPIVVFCVSVWAIARGSDCVSGEINRGTMEMLLAQPLSRLQVLFTQTFVTLSGVGLLAVVAWLGIYIGIHVNTVEEAIPATIWVPIVGPVENPFGEVTYKTVPMVDKVQAAVFIPAAFSLFSLGTMLAGVSAFLSSWDRYRWRTIGLAAGFYVVSVMLKFLGMASDAWHWCMYLSAFTAYEPEVFTQVADVTPQYAWSITMFDAAGGYAGLGPLGYDLILLGIGVTGYVAAAIIFHRRDLPAPL